MYSAQVGELYFNKILYIVYYSYFSVYVKLKKRKCVCYEKNMLYLENIYNTLIIIYISVFLIQLNRLVNKIEKQNSQILVPLIIVSMQNVTKLKYF